MRYLILIIFGFLILVLILNYSFNLFSAVKYENAILTFEQKTKPALPSIAPQFAKNYLGWENFSKRDFLFFVDYKFKIEPGQYLSEPLENIKFSLSLPGKILKTNANRIERERAIWEKFPAEGIILETRSIRFWLIILVAILFIFTLRKARKL